jgi:hypothetical protein
VSGTSESGSHDDLTAIKGGIELFQLLHQLIGYTELVLISALTAELFCIEMLGDLCSVTIFIFSDHFLVLSANNRGI